MGVGPIPHSAILRYAADDLGIDEPDRLDRFCWIMRRLDSDYLAAINAPKEKSAASLDDPEAVLAVFGQIERRVERRNQADKK